MLISHQKTPLFRNHIHLPTYLYTMKVIINEKQLKAVLKTAIHEDQDSDLLNKMLSWTKDKADNEPIGTQPLEKSVDEPEKADLFTDDVKSFFNKLENIREPLKQQKYGTMKWKEGVEAIQMALIMLGYDLPKFGVDGMFGPETAAAVNKYKKDNNILSESVLLDENSEYGDISNDLANKLDAIKNEYGKPFKINSTFRDPKRNKEVGGAKNSAHLRGNAVDIKLGDRTKEDTLRFIEIASKNGIGGIGVYKPGSVHLDVESRRAWGPTQHRASVPPWAEATIQAHEKNKINTNYASLAGAAGGSAAGLGAIGGAIGKTPSTSQTSTDTETPRTSKVSGGPRSDDDETPISQTTNEPATVTPEMVQSLDADLKEKGVTSDDLRELIDPAKISGGDPDVFTDLDLSTSEGYSLYQKICDNFIVTRNPTSPVTGKMLADGAKMAFENYQKYIPPELALAQITIEGGLATDLTNRPHRTKNPFNVGNTKLKDNPQTSYINGVNIYYSLIARRYMVNGKNADNLIRDFKNSDGKEYSGVYSNDYENTLVSLINSIRKKNENIYKAIP